MNITKTTHRILTALVVLFAASFAAAAQKAKLSLGNLVLTPGETTVVSLNLENDVTARFVAGDIFMPEIPGFEITFVKDEKGYCNIERTSRVSEFADLSAKANTAGNRMRFVIMDYDNEIPAGSGAIMTFKVHVTQIDPEAQIPLDAVATIKDARVNDIEIDEEKCPLSDGTFEGAITAPDFQLTPSQEATVTVSMTNNMLLSMFQATVKLPKGLTIVENNGQLFTPSNRVALFHKIETSPREDGSIFMMIRSKRLTQLNEIMGNAGPIFSFTVKADETFAAEDVITFTDVMGSTLKAKLLNFDPLTITVTNPDVEAGKTADAAVTALKQKLTETETALKTYSEDIQTQLAEKLQALQEEVGKIETDVTEAKGNGTIAAGLEAIQNRITKATENADALVEEAENLKKAADEATAANAAQNEADKAALEEVKALLASTNETIATYDESVQEAMTEAKAAADAALAAAETAITASFEAGTAVADKEVNAALIEAAKEAVNKLAADAKAAQDKFLADEAAAAEAAQYEANQAAVTELKALLKEAETAAKAAGYECADEVYEIKEDISVLRNKIETVHANNSSVATATEVEAMVESIKAKIAAVKKGADDKAAADANEAQYKKDTLMVNDLEKSLETVTWNFNAEVVEIYGEEIAAIQDAIAALKDAAKASYENGTSVADAEAFAAQAEDVKELIEALDNSITTGISDINGEKSNDVMYDLSGRRVVKAKGLVIKNGKKYFVK